MQKKRLLTNKDNMTLPDERYRAVVQTEKFLREVLSTPRVPKSIKDGARYCLRHYPTQYDMKVAARDAPDVFQEKMEPLTRMIMVYDQEQNKEKEN
jgi:hypothetical protein